METNEDRDDELEAREQDILKKIEEAEAREASLAKQVDAGKTKTIDLEQFGQRGEPGSIGDLEPRSYSTSESLRHPEDAAAHVLNDPQGWAEGAAKTARDRLEGKQPHASDQPEADVASAEETFETYDIPREGHYGLEVEIDAYSTADADRQVREALREMEFKPDGRNGYAYGGEQFWRDSTDGKQQEHLRYYGIADDGHHHYRAIFIAEQEAEE
jgi:hypothetical protein